MRRADLHFHILPGVDDGPATAAESIALAELALHDGTTTVVATPHVRDVDLDELDSLVGGLRRRLAEHSLPLEIRCGGELAYADVGTVTGAQLDTIAHGRPGERWVLLEAPLPHAHAHADDFAPAAAELRDRGFGVLVAHPERSPAFFADGGDLLQAELSAGSLLQVNATSLTGSHGARERDRALRLVRARLASVVASDAHRPTRGPALEPALRALLAAGVEEDLARDVVDVAPRAVLEEGLAARRAPAGQDRVTLP
jgi:protein-tyrosine phosphatase